MFADEEKVMLQEYCREMGIVFLDAENAKTMDEIVSVFRESNIHIKKIVLFETLGLAYSDGIYDETEKGSIREYTSKIGRANDNHSQEILSIGIAAMVA